MAKPTADWEILQAKIFSRWVNQKLQSRNLPTLNDLITDLAEGENLPNLMFALSEKRMEAPKGSPKKMPMVKAQKLEMINRSLNFVWDCGVEMKLKPSPENLLNGDYKDVLGLIWALMTKYMKFDEDDEEQLSAKDALIKWLQFHTAGHDGVQITNLTKSFHNGLALCALLHKFRPDDIPYSTLSPGDGPDNLKRAMNVAEKEYGVEQYLTPADILKLDEKSALVYISEYYYGINAQAKRELAAKRIKKLIKFTKENDAMKAKYQSDGEKLLAHLATAESLLQDVETVDNTMAGAKKKLADFNTYKVSEKRSILSVHLEIEEAYNSLAARLANHNRPAFTPSAETVPSALKTRINALQAKESVEAALHTELHRQIKLAQMDKRHVTASNKLTQWLAEKDTFVATDVPVSSSGEARQQLKQFDSFVKECASMKSDSLTNLKNIGKFLADEKYENIATVTEREAALETSFASLDEKATAKKPVLEDNLSREQYKEQVRLWVKVHTEVHSLLVKWIGEKKTYLDNRETIASVQEAFLQLSLLDAYKQESGDQTEGNVARLKAQGQEIRDAQYKTQYSEWVYEKPEEITALETSVDSEFTLLGEKAAAKQLYLDDALAREQFKEQTLLLIAAHKQLFNQIQAWGADKAAYLATKEEVTSSAEAKNQLSLLDAFEKEKAAQTEGAKKSFDKLAGDICDAKYQTDLSSWQYEKPEEIKALQQQVENLWGELSSASEAKKAVLEDDLARELYAEQTRLMAGQHSDKFDQISAWAAEKSTYLSSDPNVQSISDAQYHISVLESYEKELAAVTNSAVTSLKSLGAEIAARKYETSHSSYVYENTADVKQREATTDETWATLATLAQTRSTDLQAALARELRKEELRLDFANQASELKRFSADKVSTIGTAEEQKTIFGFVLEEVQNYGPTLAAEEAELASALSAKEASYVKVVEEMQSLDVKENPYTTLTTADLESFKASVEEAVAARRANYDAHLQRAQEDDALCKKFADLVVPVADKLAKGLVTAMDSSAAEEDQLKVVNGALETLEGDRSALPESAKLESEIKSRDIEINTHTNVTAEDLSASLGHYEQVLTRKKPYLEKLIEYKQFRGISPDQYAEMEAIFKEYDKDNSGSINEKELRTCLYSLGEERLKSEVARYMQEFGNGAELKFEPFRELMIKLLGDSGSTESMEESFRLISNGRDHVEKEALSKLLEDDEVSFITSTAPPQEGGYEFTPWIDEVFAR